MCLLELALEQARVNEGYHDHCPMISRPTQKCSTAMISLTCAITRDVGKSSLRMMTPVLAKQSKHSHHVDIFLRSEE